MWCARNIVPSLVRLPLHFPSCNQIISPLISRSVRLKYLANAPIASLTESCSSLYHKRRISGNTNASNLDQVSLRKVQTALMLLNEDIRRLNRIFKSDILQILQHARNEVSMDNGQGILLLQYCVKGILPDETPSSRIQLVNQIWKTLSEIGVNFQIEHFNSLLKSYVDNEHRFDPQAFLTGLESAKVAPNQVTYSQLVWAYCQQGNIAGASQILLRMKEENIPVNEAIFNALILGHSRSGDLSASESVLDTMEAAQVQPSAETYRVLLQTYAEWGDQECLKDCLLKATHSRVALSPKSILSVIISAAVSGHLELIDLLLQWIPKPESPCIELTNAIIQLVHLGYQDVAYRLLITFPEGVKGKADVAPFGNFFVREMIKANCPPSSVIAICRNLLHDKLNEFSFQKAAETALITGNYSCVWDIFYGLREEGLPLRSHYFWPMLVSARDEAEIFLVLKKMKELRVDADKETFVDYVLPRVLTSLDPDIAIGKLQDAGWPVSSTLTPALFLLLQAKELDAAIRLVEKYKSNVSAAVLIPPLALAFVHTQEHSKALDMLQFIIEHAESSGAKEANWAASFFARVASWRSTSLTKLTEEMLQRGMTVDHSVVNNGSLHLPHPQDMDEHQLECHLVELQAKKMNTRGVLRRLLLLYCRQRNLEKVLEIRLEIDKLGGEYSTGMLASLIDVYSHHGLVDDALQVLGELRRLQKEDNFKLDDYKIIDLSTVLVSQRRFQDAIQLLYEHADDGHVQPSKMISRNCWRLLDTAAKVGDIENVRYMLKVLTDLRYCKITNAILGPLVRAHICNDDYEAATNEHLRCVSTFRLLPLRQELTCYLLRKKTESKDDNEKIVSLLQKIYDANASALGHVVAQHDMVFALVEVDEIAQAKIILQKLGAGLQWQRVEKQCLRWVDEKKPAVISRMALLSRHFPKLNSSLIYLQLLKLYDRMGAHQEALSLWTELQEKDIVPPQGFLSLLADLLQRHKQSVPFALPKEISARKSP